MQLESPQVKDFCVAFPRERILPFCIASGTNWERAGITSEVVTALIVRGLLVWDERGRLP
jgi:hypothetical protein